MTDGRAVDVGDQDHVVRPEGWVLCSGQVLPINQNLALFSLLGTGASAASRIISREIVCE